MVKLLILTVILGLYVDMLFLIPAYCLAVFLLVRWVIKEYDV